MRALEFPLEHGHILTGFKCAKKTVIVNDVGCTDDELKYIVNLIIQSHVTHIQLIEDYICQFNWAKTTSKMFQPYLMVQQLFRILGRKFGQKLSLVEFISFYKYYRIMQLDIYVICLGKNPQCARWVNRVKNKLKRRQNNWIRRDLFTVAYLIIPKEWTDMLLFVLPSCSFVFLASITKNK